MNIKICGLTRRRDVERACALGASHVGFVLVEGTPRRVNARDVRELARDLPGSATPVLVFRRPTLPSVMAAVEGAAVETVQLFRFAEPLALALERRGLRVHRVREVPPVPGPIVFHPRPTGRRPWHLDVGGGGSGRRFAWDRLRAIERDFVFVGGGITPRNVAELCRFGVWGIDVSSGVEREPGVKDADLLRRLFERAAQEAIR